MLPIAPARRPDEVPVLPAGSPWWRRVSAGQATAGLVVVHVVSRLAYVATGVTFRSDHAVAYHQFIDRPALRSDLLGSLWYDHTQPPGLNLLWGLAQRLSPGDPDRLLWPLFLAAGLAIAVLLFRLLLRVGCPPLVAGSLAALWTISPTAVFTETYFLYTPFEILGLLGIALLLARWRDHGSARVVAGAFAVATALALTRSTFHLVWLAGLVGVAVLVRRDRWRVATASGLVAVLLVGGWYTKNLILFDQFGSSSWIGMNLSRVTVEQLDPDERARLVDEGVLSPYAAHTSFSGFDAMGLAPPHLDEPASDAAVLEEDERVGMGLPNLHHRDYLEPNREVLDDSLWVIRHRPRTYARGVSRSVSVTFTPSATWFGYKGNADEAPTATAVERYLLGGWDDAPYIATPGHGRWRIAEHQWILMAAYLLALVAVPVRLLRRRRWRTPTGDVVAVAFLWGTTAYLTALTVLAEFGENNRFRVVTDPAVLVLVAWLGARWRDRSEIEGEAVAS